MSVGRQCWQVILGLLAAGCLSQVRSQVYVSEARDPGWALPSAPESDSSVAEERSEEVSLSDRLSQLRVLDTRLSQMDVLEKMFQFVQMDTSMAHISQQVDRISERLAEQSARPATCSPAGAAGQTALEGRLDVLEKAVEGVSGRVDSQLGRLQRQLDALLERNVQLNTKTDTMREEVSQLLELSRIVDDQLEQTDDNLRYLRDELQAVKQKTHAIHHQQHKSETAVKEEVKERVGSAEATLKSMVFNVYSNTLELLTLLRREPSEADPDAEADYDAEEAELERPGHPLEDGHFRAKLVGEVRAAVAADTERLVAAAGCSQQQAAESAAADLLTDIRRTINSSLEQAVSAHQRPSDCSELVQQHPRSGVFTIYPNACSRGHKMQVYCDMETSGGGWTVIQRRGQFPGRSQLDFYKDWSTYKWGFGNISEEFYLGNELIHLLTTTDDFVLRVELEDFSDDRRYAEYEHFSIDGESLQYRLHVGHYTGNAGDAMSYHDGLSFSTKDRENDTWEGKNCATHYRGGWWFANCHRANLNGMYLSGHHSNYGNGLIWYPWRGFTYSLKASRMMVRPRSMHGAIPDGQR